MLFGQLQSIGAEEQKADGVWNEKDGVEGQVEMIMLDQLTPFIVERLEPDEEFKGYVHYHHHHWE